MAKGLGILKLRSEVSSVNEELEKSIPGREHSRYQGPVAGQDGQSTVSKGDKITK